MRDRDGKRDAYVKMDGRGTLTLELAHIVEMMDDEGRQGLAEMLAFDEAVLRAVMAQVGDSYEEPLPVLDWWHGADVIAKLRLLLLPKMDEQVQKLVQYLLKQIDAAELSKKQAEGHAHEMRRLWPGGLVKCPYCEEWVGKPIRCPERPPFKYAPGPKADQVEKLVEAVRDMDSKAERG